jgi:hypothetical protein
MGRLLHFVGVNEGFPLPIQDQVILLVHVAGIELSLVCIPDDMFHVVEVGEKSSDVLELDVMFLIGAVLCTASFSGCLFGRNVGGVLSHCSQLTDGLHSIDQNGLTGDTVCAWSPQLWDSRMYI